MGSYIIRLKKMKRHWKRYWRHCKFESRRYYKKWWRSRIYRKRYIRLRKWRRKTYVFIHG